MLTSFVRLLPLAFAFFAALFGSGKISQAFADLQVRGFYMPSYGVNDLVHATNEAQLESFRGQVPSASHAVLAVHVRVPGGIRSNTVVRNQVSENPSHLVPWFNLAKTKGLRTGLIVILFSDNGWSWGGYWKPTNPAAALSSYYNAIRPYVHAAQAAKVDFVILCDEWSTLYYSYPPSAVLPAFRTLVNKARADYKGKIGINVNKLEETAVKAGIVALTDFVGITAYVPLANSDHPSYEQMKANLLGPSQVRSVRDHVSSYAEMWGSPDVHGYMSYIRHVAERLWRKPIILTTGYKSTVGAAKDPGGIRLKPRPTMGYRRERGRHSSTPPCTPKMARAVISEGFSDGAGGPRECLNRQAIPSKASRRPTWLRNAGSDAVSAPVEPAEASVKPTMNRDMPRLDREKVPDR